MDDNLELPTAAPTPEASQDRDEEEQSSEDEDQGPDWTKIPYVATSLQGTALQSFFFAAAYLSRDR